MAFDRLHIGKEDRKIIERIEIEDLFNFKNKTNKEQFMFAMAFGIHSKLEPITMNGSEEWFFVKDLSEEDLALLYTCMFRRTGVLEDITKIEKVYKNAEEYAHLGFKLLSNKIDSNSYGRIEIQFESEFMDIYKTLLDDIWTD